MGFRVQVLGFSGVGFRVLGFRMVCSDPLQALKAAGKLELVNASRHLRKVRVQEFRVQVP